MSQYASQLAGCAGRFLDTCEVESSVARPSRTVASSPANSQVPDDVAAGPSFVPAVGLSTVLVSPNRALVTGGVTRDGRVLPFSVIRYLDLVNSRQCEYRWQPSVVIRKCKSGLDQDIPVSREAHTLTLDPTAPGQMLLLIGGVRRACMEKLSPRATTTPCSTLFGFHLQENRWEELKATAGCNPKAKHACGPRFAHSAILRCINSSTISGRRRSRAGTVCVYVYGGYDSLDANKPRADVHKLSVNFGKRDSRTYSWTLVKPRQVASNSSSRRSGREAVTAPQRAYHASILFENRYMVVHGGMKGSAREGVAQLSDDLYIFDFDTETWSRPIITDGASQQNQPSPRAHHSVVQGIGSDRGHIIFFGGQLQNDDYSDEIFRLALHVDSDGRVHGQWTKRHLTSLHQCPRTAYYGAARAGLLAFADSQQYLVVGGCGPTGLHVAPYTMAPFDEHDHYQVKQESSELKVAEDKVDQVAPLTSFKASPTPTDSAVVPSASEKMSPSPPSRSTLSASCPTPTSDNVQRPHHPRHQHEDAAQPWIVGNEQKTTCSNTPQQSSLEMTPLQQYMQPSEEVEIDDENQAPENDGERNESVEQSCDPERENLRLSMGVKPLRDTQALKRRLGRCNKPDSSIASGPSRGCPSSSSSESAVMNLPSASNTAPPRKRPRVHTDQHLSSCDADMSQKLEDYGNEAQRRSPRNMQESDKSMKNDSREAYSKENENRFESDEKSVRTRNESDSNDLPTQSDAASPFVTAASLAPRKTTAKERRSRLRERGRGRGWPSSSHSRASESIEELRHSPSTGEHGTCFSNTQDVDFRSALQQIDELKQAMQQLRRDKDMLTDQSQKYIETIRAREARIESLQIELRAESFAHSNSTVHDLRDEVDELKDIIREMKYERTKDAKETELLNAANLALSKDLQDAEMQEKFAAELKAQLAIKTEEVDACKLIIGEHVKAADDLRTRSERLRQRNCVLESEKDELIRANKMIAEQARREAEDKYSELECLERQLGQARRELVILTDDNKQLEEDNRSVSKERDKLRADLATKSHLGDDVEEEECGKRMCSLNRARLRDIERDLNATRKSSAETLIEYEEKKKELEELERERRVHVAGLEQVKSVEQTLRHKSRSLQEQVLTLKGELSRAEEKLCQVREFSAAAVVSFEDFANKFHSLQDASLAAGRWLQVDEMDDQRPRGAASASMTTLDHRSGPREEMQHNDKDVAAPILFDENPGDSKVAAGESAGAHFDRSCNSPCTIASSGKTMLGAATGHHVGSVSSRLATMPNLELESSATESQQIRNVPDVTIPDSSDDPTP